MTSFIQKVTHRSRRTAIRLTLSALLIFALFAFGCSGEGAAGGGFAMPPTPAEVAEAQVGRVADKFEGVGSIEAISSITVVSEIDAAVVSLPFEEGTFIKRGGLIAKLDDSRLKAELARSEALLAQSQSNYDRVEKVVNQKAGAPQDLDDADAALKVAEANLALAKANWEKTRITAPFDGIIGARRVSVGAFLRAGQTITDLANIDSIRVRFSAPERFLSRLERGAEVSVSTTAYPDYELRGKIIVIEPVLDTTTRSAEIVARLANPGRKFRAGMSANISAVLSERANAITVPNEAVFASGNESFVYVVNEDSTVSRVGVTLGTRMAGKVEVIKGLEPGQKVVRTGHQKLYEGAKVMPIMNGQPALSGN